MGSYFHLDLFTNKFRLQLAWIRSYASNNVAFDPRRFASKDSSCVSIHICTKYSTYAHLYQRCPCRFTDYNVRIIPRKSYLCAIHDISLSQT